MRTGIGIISLTITVGAMSLAIGEWHDRARFAAREIGATRVDLSVAELKDLSKHIQRKCRLSELDAREIVYLIACSRLVAPVSIPDSAAAACELVADRGLAIQDAVMNILGLEPGKGAYLEHCQE